LATLFIKAPKFGADGNIISEHQKLWGTANIVDFYGRDTTTGLEDSTKKGTTDA